MVITSRLYTSLLMCSACSSRCRRCVQRTTPIDAVDGFVFLITTSAGGQGITLTAANTVIIYDSAYNPQQDAQAIARAHRIGQTQEVTIYRFVADHTYEENMFKIAGMKQGLDAVLLSNLSSSTLNTKEAKVIEKMLKEGAMALLEHGEQGDADAEALQGQSIFEILDKRSSKRILTSACQDGDVFSKVTIDSTAAVGQDAELSWEALLPEAVAQHQRALKDAQQGHIVGPRIRKAINYNLANMGKRAPGDTDDQDYTAEEEEPAKVGDGCVVAVPMDVLLLCLWMCAITTTTVTCCYYHCCMLLLLPMLHVVTITTTSTHMLWPLHRLVSNRMILSNTNTGQKVCQQEQRRSALLDQSRDQGSGGRTGHLWQGPSRGPQGCGAPPRCGGGHGGRRAAAAHHPRVCSCAPMCL